MATKSTIHSDHPDANKTQRSVAKSKRLPTPAKRTGETVGGTSPDRHPQVTKANAAEICATRDAVMDEARKGE